MNKILCLVALMLLVAPAYAQNNYLPFLRLQERTAGIVPVIGGILYNKAGIPTWIDSGGETPIATGTVPLPDPVIVNAVQADSYTDKLGTGAAPFPQGLTSAGETVITSTHSNTATIHFVVGAIDHTLILNIGTNSHALIDAHIADILLNPHQVTASQVDAMTTTGAQSVSGPKTYSTTQTFNDEVFFGSLVEWDTEFPGFRTKGTYWFGANSQLFNVTGGGTTDSSDYFLWGNSARSIGMGDGTTTGTGGTITWPVFRPRWSVNFGSQSWAGYDRKIIEVESITGTPDANDYWMYFDSLTFLRGDGFLNTPGPIWLTKTTQDAYISRSGGGASQTLQFQLSGSTYIKLDDATDSIVISKLMALGANDLTGTGNVVISGAGQVRCNEYTDPAGTGPPGFPFGFTVDDDVVHIGNYDLTGDISIDGKASCNPTTALNNEFWGEDAGNASADGERNTGVGNAVLSSLTDGVWNSGFGDGSLRDLTTGDATSAYGRNAGGNITSGTHNTLIGYGAGLALITQDYNTMVGAEAGETAAGTENVFLGFRAGEDADASWNTFIGSKAGDDTDGNENVGIGYLVMTTVGNTATNCAALGARALQSKTSGSNVAALGYKAGWTDTTSSDRAYIGGWDGSTQYPLQHWWEVPAADFADNSLKIFLSRVEYRLPLLDSNKGSLMTTSIVGISPIDLMIDGPVSIRDSSLTTQMRVGSLIDFPNGMTVSGGLVDILRSSGSIVGINLGGSGTYNARLLQIQQTNTSATEIPLYLLSQGNNAAAYIWTASSGVNARAIYARSSASAAVPAIEIENIVAGGLALLISDGDVDIDAGDINLTGDLLFGADDLYVIGDPTGFVRRVYTNEIQAAIDLEVFVANGGALRKDSSIAFADLGDPNTPWQSLYLSSFIAWRTIGNNGHFINLGTTGNDGFYTSPTGPTDGVAYRDGGQQVWLCGTLAGQSHRFGVGKAGYTHQLPGELVVHAGNAVHEPGVVTTEDDTGIPWYRWMSAAGDLRLHSAYPVNADTDGGYFYRSNRDSIPTTDNVVDLGAANKRLAEGHIAKVDSVTTMAFTAQSSEPSVISTRPTIWTTANGRVIVSYNGLQNDISSWPPHHIHDLKLVNNATNPAFQLDIQPGHAMDSTNSVRMSLASTVTVDLTASGAGGLDEGSEASDTWYYVMLTSVESTGASTGLLTTNADSPILPGAYTHWRRIGCFYNNGSSDIRTFLQRGAGLSRAYSYTTTASNRLVLSGGGATTPTPVDLSAYVCPVSRNVTILVNQGAAKIVYMYQTSTGPVLEEWDNSTVSLSNFPTDTDRSISYATESAGSVDITARGFSEDL